MPVPSVLVLDNALDHGFYRPVEHWTRLLGFEPESVYVPEAAKLPDPGRDRTRCAGLGTPSSAGSPSK